MFLAERNAGGVHLSTHEFEDARPRRRGKKKLRDQIKAFIRRRSFRISDTKPAVLASRNLSLLAAK